MPSSDPRDRIVYPIHKLMVDSYIIADDNAYGIVIILKPNPEEVKSMQ